MGFRHHEQEACPPGKLKRGNFVDAQGNLKEIACILCKYHDACLVNTKKIFCLQVKIKLCVEYIIIMRLISWIHSRGSETIGIVVFHIYCKLINMEEYN
jgi:hypothetical protein